VSNDEEAGGSGGYMLIKMAMMMTTSAHNAHRMGTPSPGRTVDSTIMRVVSVLPGSGGANGHGPLKI